MAKIYFFFVIWDFLRIKIVIYSKRLGTTALDVTSFHMRIIIFPVLTFDTCQMTFFCYSYIKRTFRVLVLVHCCGPLEFRCWVAWSKSFFFPFFHKDEKTNCLVIMEIPILTRHDCFLTIEHQSWAFFSEKR